MHMYIHQWHYMLFWQYNLNAIGKRVYASDYIISIKTNKQRQIQN
jgi:hypothetical protein